MQDKQREKERKKLSICCVFFFLTKLPTVEEIEGQLEGQASRLPDLMRGGLAHWLVVPFLTEDALAFRTNEQREYNSTVYLRDYDSLDKLNVSLELVVRDMATVVLNDVTVGRVSPGVSQMSETVKLPDNRVVDKQSFQRGSAQMTGPNPRTPLRHLDMRSPSPRYAAFNVSFASGTNRLAIYVHCRGNNPAALVSAARIPAAGGGGGDGDPVFSSDSSWRLAVAGSGPQSLINPSIVA
eukprot:Tamp_24888.p1 GENE.Tamp_24888~~Tamp_24888.p1  ORF type:complete len:239 (+),score=17.67 Tamp_24888:75-791(+)